MSLDFDGLQTEFTDLVCQVLQTQFFTLRLRLFFSHSKKLRLLGGESYTTGCEAAGQEKTIEQEKRGEA